MTTSFNPALRKKRLKLLLCLFFLLFAVPIYFLIQTVYQQLRNEAYYHARQQAEQLVDRLESALQDLIVVEQRRPSAEYSFFNVLASPLLDSSGIKFSPLSEIPPQTNIPGLIGYFQIAPDGSFHIPALPDLNQDNHSGLSLKELQSRLALKRQLQRLLAREEVDRVAAEETEYRQSAEQNQTEQYVVGRQEERHETKAEDADQKILEKLKDNSAVKNKPRSAQRISPFQNRKEQVQLPDQAMAGSFFKRAPQPAVSMALQQDESMRNENETANIEILSFESEITPLQLMRVKQRYFCFYRQVWHDNNRYTQGFLVGIEAFFDVVARPVFKRTSVDSVSLRDQGQMLTQLQFSATTKTTTIYGRLLNPPFDRLELLVNSNQVSAGKETLLVDMLASAITLTLTTGLLFFYRLLSRQIELSRQQYNFISAVSHELKTPLTSIRMYGEMLRSGWVADEQKKQQYYDFIFFESERLSRLIANVLQLARIDHRTHQPELNTVSAALLLHRIPARIEAQIAASGFTVNLIETDKDPASVTANIDEDAFFQILINLVDNALKFAAGSEHQVIDIGYRLTANCKWLEFYVRDYGPGIDKQQQHKIFQLFYRPGDELTRATPGTGIGLALVAQLAESMKAHVSVVKRQPGAEFRIRFAAMNQDCLPPEQQNPVKS